MWQFSATGCTFFIIVISWSFWIVRRQLNIHHKSILHLLVFGLLERLQIMKGGDDGFFSNRLMLSVMNCRVSSQAGFG